MPGTHPLADPESVRLAMRQWVAGVTVVTSLFDGLSHGMTVSSFTSISLVPPMILISLERGTRTHLLITHSRIFAVTILDASQEWISERFAGRTGVEENRLEGIETESLVTGAPFIKGGLAYLDCRVTTEQEAGTSTVFLADILAARGVIGGFPLVYTNQTYFRLQK